MEFKGGPMSGRATVSVAASDINWFSQWLSPPRTTRASADIVR